MPIATQPVAGGPVRKCNYNFATGTRLFDYASDLNECSDVWQAPTSDDTTETQKITGDYYQEAIIKNGKCVPLAATNLPPITSQGIRTRKNLNIIKSPFLSTSFLNS